ncbi:MAG: hypothetical protein K0S18_21 [Anaerocolumna sp.]|nr:hypothetical protein [Anaerocolumna sp.]
MIKRVDTPSHVSKNNTDVYWLCKCNCGNEKDVFVRTANLNNGRVSSCGCWQQESRLIHNRKYNKFELSGDFGVGYTEDNQKFYFDLDDYKLIKDVYWSIDKDGYVYNFKSQTRMHRLVTNCPEEFQVDHISHCKEDNRKCNLRVVNNQQNQRNKSVHKNSQTQVQGVRKQINKYMPYIVVDGKYIHLGSFEKIEDAISARREAEDKYFGEFSYYKSINRNHSFYK